MSGRKVWLGPITVQGMQSGDRRLFDEFTYREFPLSLRYQTSDSGMHSNAVPVGTIEAAAAGPADGTKVLQWGIGYLDETDDASAAAQRIESQSARYVSIDGLALEKPIDEAMDPATGEVVPEEKIYEAYAQAEEALMEDDPAKYAQLMEWIDSLEWRTRYPLTQVAGATILTIPCFEEAQLRIVGDETGVPDLVAALAEATGNAPALTASATPAETFGHVDDALEGKPLWAITRRLVAAGAPALTYKAPAPIARPAAWYQAQSQSQLVPFTITDEGRMFGHVAPDNMCHRSWGDRCVMVPKEDKLEQFLHGETPLDDGSRVVTGIITYGGPHAPDSISNLEDEIQRRMEDLGCQLGTVSLGRDEFGIFAAGAVHPDVPSADLNRVIAAAPSGDWREYLFFDQRWQRGKLALFGIHIVNCPGFLTPRVTANANGGMRLVASVAALAGGGCGCGGHAGACSCSTRTAVQRAQALEALASLDAAHRSRRRVR